jgi:hypothetical protein
MPTVSDQPGYVELLVELTVELVLLAGGPEESEMGEDWGSNRLVAAADAA